MLTTDPYYVLGLTADADTATVRQVFRTLAQKYHPDHNPSPEAVEDFLRIRAAYEELIDPARRRRDEAAAVMEEVEKAAAEVKQHRAYVSPKAPPVCIPLDIRRFPLPGLLAPVAVRAAAGLMVSGAALLALTPVGGLVMAASGAACLALAATIWLTRRTAAELRFYAGYFIDSRWAAGRIGWGDIRALEVDHERQTLDLELAPDMAERLAKQESFPTEALLWSNKRPFYRLTLGAWLPDGLALVQARTGLQTQ